MKNLLILPLLFVSLYAGAVKPVVEKGTTVTSPGIGGNTQIAFAFAKGDVVTIDAKASRLLERMLVFVFPEQVMGRQTYTKHPKLSFTMTQDGIAVFRFISDRDGSNTIDYTITRMPASDAVQNYNTKVDWQKPVDHASTLIPKRVGE